MAETNGDFETKVERILITKTKLVWGIILAVAIVFGAFMEVKIELAKNYQKLVDIDDAISKHLTDTQSDQQRIATLEALVLKK